MKFTDNAFVLSTHRISQGLYGITILTQNHGRIAGLLKGKNKPMITAFGVAIWVDALNYTYIKFEQIAPSVIMNFLDRSDLDRIVSKFFSIDSFEVFEIESLKFSRQFAIESAQNIK